MSTKDHLRRFILTGCAALVAVNCTGEVEKQAPDSGTELQDSDSREGKRDGPGEKRKKQ
jgi:hypothetical protein